MSQIANLLVGIVALVHILLLVGEIFFWQEPVIHQRLGFTLDEALKVAPIVANAGLYNGFLAAGLIWGWASGKNGNAIKVFFLLNLEQVYGAIAFYLANRAEIDAYLGLTE